MTEENTPAAAQDQQADGAQFALQRIYLKDLSFETPMGIEVFQREVKPQIGQEISTAVNQVDENNFEVVLTLTITVKDADQVVYLVEVQQAGIFLVKGLDKEHMVQVVNVLCPATLFPYAREVVDNVVTKGSFPSLMLPPVNFDAMYEQAVEEAKKQKEQETKH